MTKILLLLTLAAISRPESRADLLVVQRVDGMGQSGEMIIKVQGQRSRTDMAGQISVIRDAASGESVTLMHAQKSFLRISDAAATALREKMMDQLPSAHPSAAPSPGPKLQPTGQKEKIGPYDTEEFRSQIGAMTVHYWVAKTFPNWSAVLSQLQQVQQNGLDQLMKNHAPQPADFGGMPVRTEVEIGDQKVTTTVIRVEEKPVAASEFTVPADYQERPAPSFGDSPADPKP